jgi:dinuclear metal center protein, YbgI/SA1388 family
MSVTMDEFIGLVEGIAPRSLAYDWDNTGLLLRCGDRVSNVLICLDATQAAADEAARSGCDMILSHHPLLFTPLKTLDYTNASQGVLMRLVRSGISLYAAHTSFDRAPGGINDALAALLGMTDVQAIGEEGIVRVGSLPRPCDKAAFIARVKSALGTARMRATSGFEGEISRVAVVGGSGGEYAAQAQRAGAQALLTGEAKHHHWLEAQAIGMLIVEAGHFETERCFADAIFGRLQSQANALQLQLGFKKAECVQTPCEVV